MPYRVIITYYYGKEEICASSFWSVEQFLIKNIFKQRNFWSFWPNPAYLGFRLSFIPGEQNSILVGLKYFYTTISHEEILKYRI